MRNSVANGHLSLEARRKKFFVEAPHGVGVVECWEVNIATAVPVCPRYECPSYAEREDTSLKEFETTMSGVLTDTTLALALYRHEHSTYPESLNDLLPEHSTEAPRDIFSGDSIRYRRKDDGYVLWSVGKDQKDDGGKDYDDIVIRMPVRDEDFIDNE